MIWETWRTISISAGPYLGGPPSRAMRRRRPLLRGFERQPHRAAPVGRQVQPLRPIDRVYDTECLRNLGFKG